MQELTAFLDEYSDRHSAIPNDTTLVLMCLPLSIFKVSSLVKLTPLDMFDAPLEGSTVIIVYLFREVCCLITERIIVRVSSF